MLKAVTALIVMSACAYVLVRYAKKHNPQLNGTRGTEILSSLRLTGRDVFFVVRCGPEVIAFTVGASGTCVVGRWSYDDWLDAKDNS
ncbi:MAG: hypothetical protein IJT02_01035 [Synergistaceae bacterium]|nr:hypothetical protein [Synergistaceae bacterium]